MGEQNQKKKLTKAQLRTVIISAVSFIFCAAFIILNFFIPVRYLPGYLVLRNKGAAEGVMRVSFLNVGFGDCIIIELPDGKNMLIDAGNGLSKNQLTILKYLNKCDIDVIDYLVCSSVNAAHCGGLYEILQYKKVSEIFMPYCPNSYVTDEYRKFVLAVEESGIKTNISEYGAGVNSGNSGYFFTFLSPSHHTDPEGEYFKLNTNPSSKINRNNASAIMWLEYAGTSFLFTSDAGDDALSRVCSSYELLRENYPVRLEDCDILQAANHGGEKSANVAAYDLTKPATVIFSVGENAENCPSVQALSNAVNYAGKELYRTDEHGTVTIEVTVNGYAVS